MYNVLYVYIQPNKRTYNIASSNLFKRQSRIHTYCGKSIPFTITNFEFYNSISIIPIHQYQLIQKVKALSTNSDEAIEKNITDCESCFSFPNYCLKVKTIP